MADFLDVQMFRCSPIVCFILNIKHSWNLKQLNIVHAVAGSMLPINANLNNWRKTCTKMYMQGYLGIRTKVT